MKHFYDSDAVIENTGEFGESFVSYDGKQVEYLQIEEWLFNLVEEEGLSLDAITLKDFTRANNELILMYISENGK